ncbi:hypothetical protein P3F83_23575 [Mycobacteroides immunogenum]|uniref:hypothetical protein n=1 Tax=Mycobacteroides immunogenum TaxID=83262 RepID=UPI0025B774DA|nr:hypothetical protein [Mycobacteroides immunogenum]WJR33392.1 hypothetical protein P3F83_23575 [Mycobacteroides immunogenum]
MTTETIHDGDLELRPSDAPEEWVQFTKEARFQARIREGRGATIKLFPRRLQCDWEDDEVLENPCSSPAIAVVTDEHEFMENCHLCDVHLLMYLGDVIPLVRTLEERARATD